ncbi:MAG: hypothetical protein WCV90_04505 [Candidatus Woesearchaeota archaeon]|jgi:hypothetical protein
MKLFNKKGDGHLWWIIAVAAIALIVVILLLIWFRGAGEGAFGAINKNIAGVGDCDSDKIADMFDKCPCDKNYGETAPATGTRCKVCTGNKNTDCVPS